MPVAVGAGGGPAKYPPSAYLDSQGVAPCQSASVSSAACLQIVVLHSACAEKGFIELG